MIGPASRKNLLTFGGYGLRITFRFPHRCGVGHFRKFISIFHTVTGRFLSRVSILTRDIDIAIMSVVCPSVRLSVCCVPVFYGNVSIYCYSFFSPHGSPIILDLWIPNIVAKFRRGHPLRGRKYTFSSFQFFLKFCDLSQQDSAIVTLQRQ